MKKLGWEKSNTVKTFCTFPSRTGGFCARETTDHDEWRCPLHQSLYVHSIEDDPPTSDKHRLVAVDDDRWGRCDIDLESRNVFCKGVHIGRLSCYDNVWFVE